MSQEQIKQDHIVGLDVMGCPMTYDPGVDLSDPFIDKIGLVFDRETGSTRPDYSEKVNLVELIQTYRDQCGMELAKKLIAQGADPSQFADDGQHSGDVTDPTLADAQSRANAAIMAGATVDQIRESLGLPVNAADLDDSTLSALVEKVIREKYPNIIQQPEASGNKDGGAE